jgi:hypothetical protein
MMCVVSYQRVSNQTARTLADSASYGRNAGKEWSRELLFQFLLASQTNKKNTEKITILTKLTADVIVF